MKFVRVAAAVFASLFLTVLLTVGGVLFWAYHNPLSAFQKIEKYILPPDLKILWKDLRVSFSSLGGLDFVLDLEIDELSVRKEIPAIEVPIRRVHVKASVFPFARQAKLHLIEAEATDAMTFKANPLAPPSPERNPFQHAQSFVSVARLIKQHLSVETLRIRADNVTYRLGDGGELKMKIEMKRTPAEPLEFSFSLDNVTATPLQVTASGNLDFTQLDSSNNAFLNARVQISGLGLETTQSLQMFSQESSSRLLSKGPIEFRRGKMKLTFNPELVLDLTPSRADLSLKSGVRGLPGPLVKVDDISIDLTTPLDSDIAWSEKPSKIKVTAPIELFFVKKNLRAQMERNCACKLPETVKTEAGGNLWLQRLLMGKENPKIAEKQTVVDGKVTVESVRNKIFTIDLAADIRVDRTSSTFEFFPFLDSTMSIHGLQTLMPLFKEYKILIPAPLNVLDGKIELKAKGPITTTEKGSRFPLALTVDLASQTQRIWISTEALVDMKPTFDEAHFNVKALIHELRLDLPPLDPLGGIPRIVADSRFVRLPKPKIPPPPSKFKLSFSFEIETKTPGAIRLASKYFSPNLPLTLSLHADGLNDNEGFIQTEPFHITYLRRTVNVEALRIDIDPKKEGVFPMKGHFSIRQTDYTVFLDIEGTTKNPAVTLSSEPYLPKDDIIAVLLYDRTNDQLVSSDAEAAGGVQAAIADRAIGLFGLWAFASTPIKSFSYNPVTKVYAATLSVSDDLTAGIGTNWEESTHLELRKRVSRRWSLTAAWTPATPDEDATTKLVLQWEKRF